MSFFHPFVDAKLKDNSPDAVKDLFDSRYRVKNVKQGTGGKYYVNLKDGHSLRVKVAEKTTIFGEKRAYVSFVDE